MQIPSLQLGIKNKRVGIKNKQDEEQTGRTIPFGHLTSH